MWVGMLFFGIFCYVLTILYYRLQFCSAILRYTQILNIHRRILSEIVHGLLLGLLLGLSDTERSWARSTTVERRKTTIPHH